MKRTARRSLPAHPMDPMPETSGAGPRPRRCGDAGRRAAIARARGFARGLAPVLLEIRAEGFTTPSGIARAMTRRGVRKPRGSTVWAASCVQKLLRTLGEGAER
ncbi:hypothetical protein [Methylobacterium sp. Leaf100]|uniref:hypothetical protein n=3 Tax=Methylobacterium TaxID=407 RepID=UPI000A9C6F22|nr:hypothetical protein [Methylobacterium sp. Leaf100]